jgi:hypothetical protein
VINIEFCRNEWLPALRGGRYKQTKNTLMARFDAGKVAYCCLGVAARRLGAVERGTFRGEVQGVACDLVSLAAPREAEGRDNFLPQSLGEKIGLYDGQYLPVPHGFNGTLYKGEEIPLTWMDRPDQPCINLAQLNDELEFTFDEIADVIEIVCDAWDNVGTVKESGRVQMKPTLAVVGA